MVGGYQIIDLQNKEFQNGVGIVCEGIFELLKGTRKTTLLTNINIDGGEFKDMFVNFAQIGPNIFALTNIGPFQTQILIEENDVVTFNIMEE